MVRGIEGNEMSTPRPKQKKESASASQSGKNQKSILGFFQKKSANSPASSSSDPITARKTPTSTLDKKAFTKLPASITPIPSSDAPDLSSPIKQETELTVGRNKENGLLSPVTPLDGEANRFSPEVAGVAFSSPSRKVCLHEYFAL